MDEVDQPRRRSDGEQTHVAILETAMRVASLEGINSLTIGRLAQEVGVSKSGVYAHFGSKQQLQMETVDAGRDVFFREVLGPGLTGSNAIERLEGVCEAFLSYVERRVFPGGCLFAGLLAEVDATSGPIHDRIAEDQRAWAGLLARLISEAQDEGDIRTDVDPAQLAFEIDGALHVANYLFILYREPEPLGRGRAAVANLVEGSR